MIGPLLLYTRHLFPPLDFFLSLDGQVLVAVKWGTRWSIWWPRYMLLGHRATKKKWRWKKDAWSDQASDGLHWSDLKAECCCCDTQFSTIFHLNAKIGAMIEIPNFCSIGDQMAACKLRTPVLNCSKNYQKSKLELDTQIPAAENLNHHNIRNYHRSQI